MSTPIPQRIATVGGWLRRHTPMTVHAITVGTGLSPPTVMSTLRVMGDRGLATYDAIGDEWRWTGGSILVPWTDLTSDQRAIILALRKGGALLTSGIEAQVHRSGRVIHAHLVALEAFGWVVREFEGSPRGRPKVRAHVATDAIEVLAGIFPDLSSMPVLGSDYVPGAGQGRPNIDYGPRRLHAVASCLRKRGSDTAQSIAITVGVMTKSMLRTLIHMAGRGQVREQSGGWTWTGGDITVAFDDLTTDQRGVLRAIAERGPVLAVELAKAIGRPQTSVSEHIVELVSYGWLSRAAEPNPKGGRARVLVRLVGDLPVGESSMRSA